MATITTNYNIGDSAYFVINSTADIIPCTITAIHIDNPSASELVSYDVVTDHFGIFPTHLKLVGQSELAAFLTAKAALLSWVNQQVAAITAMTTPPVI